MYSIPRSLPFCAVTFLALSPAFGLSAEPSDTAMLRDRERQAIERQREREQQREGPDAEPLDPIEERDRFRSLDDRLTQLRNEIEALHREEIELESMVQTAEIEERHDEVKELMKPLVHLQREIRIRQLELDGFMRERDGEVERRELMRMTDRLRYVATWRDVAFEPPQAIMMATQSIVELHVGGGEPQRAVELLEGLLERVEELGSRTAIRFALKDVYAEMGDRAKATHHMTEVILENAGAQSAH